MTRLRPQRFLLLLFLSLVSAACTERDETPPASAAVSAAGFIEAEQATDWPTYGGQASGTQYSSLTQINRENVDQLELAWEFRTGDVSEWSPESHATNYQVTPILQNDMLYLCTPLNNVIALDPGTGSQIWRFDLNKPRGETMYGYHNCRGVSYWEASDAQNRNVKCGKRVLQATDHGFLLALDADTGDLCPDFGTAGSIDLNKLDYRGEGRISVTSPPAIFSNVVIVGGTVIDNKYRDSLDGIVRGFDVLTGRELWSWNPIPQQLSAEVGGANTWAPMSVDLQRGWVFLPTGSPSYDTYGINRTEPIPDGNAVVALDALSGEKIWSFQTVHHDLWDYDLASMPTLVTVSRNGQATEAVLQATKTGFVFVLDRDSGDPLFPVEERPVPESDVEGELAAATQPFPLLPAPVTSQSLRADDAWGTMIVDRNGCREQLAALRNEGLFTPPSVRGSVLHPSFLGGTNWGGVAYDAANGVAVMNSSNLVSAVTLVPRAEFDPEVHAPPGTSTYEMRGSPYVMTRRVLMSSLGAPCNPPPWGQLTAIDMTNGQTLWQIPFGRVEFGAGIKTLPSWGAPNQGGPIVTKGGLVFIGASLDSRFRAYDLMTGDELWSASTPAPATATPMTYTFGSENRQFVVIAAGGHGAFQTKLSDAIVAFALP
ncbi:MAG: pyrroloquinoline quinone-dependent dehydrogenase [Gammaproteobacteria bacterium]|nr:pyrroloquinoline quinone-dependent dehydrogenase [Gammaproteobacteria bacterium]